MGYIDIARLLLANGLQLSYPFGVVYDKDNSIVVTFFNTISQLTQEKQRNQTSSQVLYWLRQNILPNRVAMALSPDQLFIIETATQIAEQLGVLSVLKSVIKYDNDTDIVIRDALNFLNNFAQAGDLEWTAVINAFCVALKDSAFINSASMNQIRNALQESNLSSSKNNARESSAQFFSSLKAIQYQNKRPDTSHANNSQLKYRKTQ